jgi:multisubunit Na+/H+ antiporter MnhE subunit
MIMALLSKATPQMARRANLLITGIGIAIGGILIIQNPLGSRCLELTSYLVIFSFAYRYITMRSSQLAVAKLINSNLQTKF